jgi:hypothetical protein
MNGTPARRWLIVSKAVMGTNTAATKVRALNFPIEFGTTARNPACATIYDGSKDRATLPMPARSYLERAGRSI